MQAVVYYISLPFIYLIAYLPFPLLYLFSDFLNFWVFSVFDYRKKVVQSNLRNSFPEKSEKELRAIEKRFYQFFCDLIVETIKTLTITPKQVKKRVSVDNLDIYQNYFSQRQSLIMVLGHFGNWELAGARYSQEAYHQLKVIYHPLKNKYFNRLIIKMRTRLGNGLYPMKETARCMIQDKNTPTITAFIADQTPPPERAYWTTFLNQETPVFFGTEKFSKKFNYPIIYTSTKRIKRGYYHIQTEVLVEDPSKMKEYEISELHTKRLEQDIIAQPEIWLWTHKRWKHKRR